jgi:potassium large conductance calcium-activated channel subfamily M alpha protein 1
MACRTLLEVVDDASLRFLEFRPTDESLSFSLWPQYCCGRVYRSSTLDTLLAQSWYNDTLILILRKLILGTAAANPADGGPGSGGKAAAATHYTEYSHMVQLRVPLPYRHRPYRDLFMELVLTRGVLPVALYRSHSAHSGALLDYVVTNPPPTTILHKNDRLFVLVGDGTLFHARERTGGGAGGAPVASPSSAAAAAWALQAWSGVERDE